MKVNKTYKSSVFSLLFDDPDLLKELYCAIEGIELSPDIPIDINTLSNILVKGMINDISFIIDNRLIVLIEHQSTINNNMPLRIFKYIEKLYDKIIDYSRIHNEKLIKIPKPEFIVLYNGEKPYPENKKLRLSDAFMDINGLGTKYDQISLELIVQVYNINHGQNPEIQQRCETLRNYSFFINKIREYQRTELTLEKAIEHAVKYCLDNNILKKFLGEHGSEVVSMLVHEYTTEDFLEARYEEGIEIGTEQGIERGIEIGTEQGIGKGEQNIINLLKSGKSPEEIIRDYDKTE